MTATRRGSMRRLLGALIVAAAVAAPALDVPPAGSIAAAGGLPTADCSPPQLGRGTGEGRNDPVLFPPTVGELRIAVLFVDFADVRGTRDPGALSEAHIPRVTQWYREVSYGRLQLVVTPLRRWLTLPGPVAQYAADYQNGLATTVADAISAADPAFDFGGFQSIYFVFPTQAQEELGPIGVLIREEPLRVDGAEIRVRAFMYDDVAESVADRAVGFERYIAHETGHVLGLPDLYDQRIAQSFHAWDVMAGSPRPGGMFAWHRWKLGWLDHDQIACFSGRGQIEATVAPLEGPGGTKAIVLRRGHSAYVVEVRQPVGEDATICKKGVLVYEVDFQTPAGQADIRLVPASADSPELVERCGPRASAPFDVGPGEISRVSVFGYRFEVLAALGDGSYRVRVTQVPARRAGTSPVKTIRVEAREMRFSLSARSAPRGRVVFVVRNTGRLVHDFRIKGRRTPRIRPGRTARLTVEFSRPGRYRYVCTVPGHAAAGMRGTFTVR